MIFDLSDRSGGRQFFDRLVPTDDIEIDREEFDEERAKELIALYGEDYHDTTTSSTSN